MADFGQIGTSSTNRLLNISRFGLEGIGKKIHYFFSTTVKKPIPSHNYSTFSDDLPEQYMNADYYGVNKISPDKVNVAFNLNSVLPPTLVQLINNKYKVSQTAPDILIPSSTSLKDILPYIELTFSVNKITNFAHMPTAQSYWDHFISTCKLDPLDSRRYISFVCEATQFIEPNREDGKWVATGNIGTDMHAIFDHCICLVDIVKMSQCYPLWGNQSQSMVAPKKLNLNNRSKVTCYSVAGASTLTTDKPGVRPEAINQQFDIKKVSPIAFIPAPFSQNVTRCQATNTNEGDLQSANNLVLYDYDVNPVQYYQSTTEEGESNGMIRIGGIDTYNKIDPNFLKEGWKDKRNVHGHVGWLVFGNPVVWDETMRPFLNQYFNVKKNQAQFDNFISTGKCSLFRNIPNANVSWTMEWTDIILGKKLFCGDVNNPCYKDKTNGEGLYLTHGLMACPVFSLCQIGDNCYEPQPADVPSLPLNEAGLAMQVAFNIPVGINTTTILPEYDTTAVIRSNERLDTNNNLTWNFAENGDRGWSRTTQHSTMWTRSYKRTMCEAASQDCSAFKTDAGTTLKDQYGMTLANQSKWISMRMIHQATSSPHIGSFSEFTHEFQARKESFINTEEGNLIYWQEPFAGMADLISHSETIYQLITRDKSATRKNFKDPKSGINPILDLKMRPCFLYYPKWGQSGYGYSDLHRTMGVYGYRDKISRRYFIYNTPPEFSWYMNMNPEVAGIALMNNFAPWIRIAGKPPTLEQVGKTFLDQSTSGNNPTINVMVKNRFTKNNVIGGYMDNDIIPPANWYTDPNVSKGIKQAGKAFWNKDNMYNLVKARWRTIPVISQQPVLGDHFNGGYNWISETNDPNIGNIYLRATAEAGMTPRQPTFLKEKVSGEEAGLLILSIDKINSTDVNTSSNEVCDFFVHANEENKDGFQIFTPLVDEGGGKGKENVIPINDSSILNPNTGEVNFVAELQTPSGQPYPFLQGSRSLVAATISVYLK